MSTTIESLEEVKKAVLAYKKEWIEQANNKLTNSLDVSTNDVFKRAKVYGFIEGAGSAFEVAAYCIDLKITELSTWEDYVKRDEKLG